MALMYKVTASALNLRTLPNKTAPRILPAMPRNTVVVRVADPALATDWYRIEWNGKSGYAASAYLEAVAGSPPAAPVPSPDIELPPAGAVETRDRNMARLHPVVRAAVAATVTTLNNDGIPFRVFEGFRTPERQRWLYAQGRTRPGAIVTKAKAWQSMHQYGLAVDLVLSLNGQWSWDDSGERRNWWREMHRVAEANGLAPLSFELPHVELRGASWQSLQQGALPEGGDEIWYESLAFAAERWRRTGDSPSAPPLSIGERPALPE